jgi:hypothetical protein
MDPALLLRRGGSQQQCKVRVSITRQGVSLHLPDVQYVYIFPRSAVLYGHMPCEEQRFRDHSETRCHCRACREQQGNAQCMRYTVHSQRRSTGAHHALTHPFTQKNAHTVNMIW